MVKFAVDEKKCVHCGVCVKKCPANIIIMPDKKDFPKINHGSEKYCLKCGHCKAFCLQRALELKYDGAVIKEYEVLPVVSSSDIASHMRFRRSIRHYKNEDVPKEKIEEIMDIVRYAPTGVNYQEVKWIIVHSRQEVKKLAGGVIDWMREVLKSGHGAHAEAGFFPVVINAWENGIDGIFRGAPHVAITCASKAFPIAPVDGVIALTYFELAAPSFGLGCCWAGFFDMALKNYPPLVKMLNLPSGHNAVGSIMFGFPSIKQHNIPYRNPADITWK